MLGILDNLKFVLRFENHPKRGPYKTALIAAIHHQLRSAAVDDAATRLLRRLNSTVAPHSSTAASQLAASITAPVKKTLQ